MNSHLGYLGSLRFHHTPKSPMINVSIEDKSLSWNIYVVAVAGHREKPYNLYVSDSATFPGLSFVSYHRT